MQHCINCIAAELALILMLFVVRIGHRWLSAGGRLLGKYTYNQGCQL